MSWDSTSVVSQGRTGADGAPSVEWLQEFAGRWFDAWNSHQVDRLLELLTEDVEIHDDSWPKTMHGHAEVREFLEALWRAIPDMTFELLEAPYVIPGKPRAALHWRGSGTFTGRMDPPGFAPTGRHWVLDGADFQEYRDGRICKLRVAVDMMTLLRQLGLMPATGSRAERAMAAAQRAGVRVQRKFRRRRGS
jgi:steroid delta-isomerase-like uncharacterized protein